ncbi:MAG: hypothetical protein KDA78_03815 [Planctomycetaceae bacterium]|nr:hypothetical protein [Planctomycetaceae bacterium]
MPAWPGGPCPDCGDDMPPNLVTCQTCRALLNPDLEMNFVEIPEFIPLEEISEEEMNKEDVSSSGNSESTSTQVPLVEARGVYVYCSGCRSPLKVPTNFLGKNVSCKHCSGSLVISILPGLTNVQAAYVDCPHCNERIKAARQFLNRNVACKHCNGALNIHLDEPPKT